VLAPAGAFGHVPNFLFSLFASDDCVNETALRAPDSEEVTTT
jgi:hypothetical protein